MKYLTTRIFVFASILFLSSCSSHYISRNFESETTNHKLVAVVPVKMVFTGRMPANMTQEQITQQNNTESQAFQVSLYHNIMRTTKRGKKPFRVDFQSVSETNALIADYGVNIEDTWDMDPKVLADILGVDAVVKSIVEKERYLSQMESFAISTTIGILNRIPETGGVIPGRVAKTNDVRVSLSTVNAENGTVLYSDTRAVGMDWSKTPEQCIEVINRKITRNFPYRMDEI